MTDADRRAGRREQGEFGWRLLLTGPQPAGVLDVFRVAAAGGGRKRAAGPMCTHTAFGHGLVKTTAGRPVSRSEGQGGPYAVRGPYLNRSIPGHAEAVISTSFSPSGKQLASGSGDTTVRFWDLSTQTPPSFAKVMQIGSFVLVSPDGFKLASACKQGKVMLWDPRTGNQIGKTSLPQAMGHCTSLGTYHKMNPECRKLASASKDGDVRIWDTVTCLTILSLTGHSKAVTSVKGRQWTDLHIFPRQNNQGILHQLLDKSELWDSITGKFITSLRGHVQAVYMVAWSADSRLLLSSSADSTLKVWSMKTKKLELDLPGHADEVLLWIGHQTVPM
ncbi:unnamed protein product [Chrysodeixis includens]|uniref:Uncharacterized protein n=1 Tax=Chrysodeixis includens TaxID=689277 RepID=A0A9N8KVS1_CHRIL|nr:unnamed protein product [Chrysodeixis includens]